jgi:hypothetical protein
MQYHIVERQASVQYVSRVHANIELLAIVGREDFAPVWAFVHTHSVKGDFHRVPSE